MSGRDPLGLSRLEQQLADALMEGITTITDRARYYSMYCWILRRLVEQGHDESRARFERNFQRLEAAVALATRLQSKTSSVIGDRQVTGRVSARSESAEVDLDFRVLPSNELGGFGQNYAGSMFALGLTSRDDTEIYRVEPVGEPFAAAVSSGFRGTRWIEGGLDRRSSVSWSELKACADRLSLDGIREPWASTERELLIDLLFARKIPQGAARNTGGLRSSLLRLLWVIEAYRAAEISLESEPTTLDFQMLYAPTYYGVLSSSTLDEAEPFSPPAPLAATPNAPSNAGRWRQFCLHQYLTYTLEWLLWVILELVGAEPRGASVDEVAKRCTTARFEAYLANAVRSRAGTPALLLAALGVDRVPDAALASGSLDRFGLASPLSEEALIRSDVADPEERAAWVCLSLGVLYAKWRGYTDDPDHRQVAAASKGDLSAQWLLHRLDAWLAGGSWDAALRELIQIVASTHDRVMYDKRRLDSCWLTHEEGRLKKEQDYEPYLRAPRQRQALRILDDLLLVDFPKEGIVTLTAAGRAVLRAEIGVPLPGKTS
jgi:hypothetical protein